MGFAETFKALSDSVAKGYPDAASGKDGCLPERSVRILI